jgi:sialic acid synthase SpsE
MLKETFGKPVGFSDHTLGTSIPLAAISLGAKVIEKHFTLDKNFPGWDHAVSADPEELKYLVEEGKKIIEALGNYQRILSKDEQEQRKSFRRSIVAKRNLRKGKILTIEDIDFKRPGTGIAPDEMNYVVGRVTNRDVAEDDQILWRDLT